ncbi:MAG: hypothetical protein KJ985_04330 [Proteobacteria bacterium]|nr:hypothetical protein [Pseudomonadota bacterium]
MNVPFADRGEAKALGARWDGVKGLWYVSAGRDLQAFQQWDRPRGTKEAIDELIAECQEAGISGFPTWKIPNGELVSGFKTLEELSELSGCSIE